MQTSAKISADSISPAGHRLTTFEATFPRIILSELNTHRVLSRNSASSRAIPVEKMIARVLEDPYVPTHWGKNQRGMQAGEDLSADDQGDARRLWMSARDHVARYAEAILKVGVHKQMTNRLLEPFMWHVALVTGTEWSNFFNLRDNKDAHPDFRDLAHAMRDLYEKGEPWKADYGQWHTPLLREDDWDYVGKEQKTSLKDQGAVDNYLCKVSIGRCARTSYMTHDGRRDPNEDVALFNRLSNSGHMSPFEHVARPMTKEELELFKQKKMVWNDRLKQWIWIDAEYYTHSGQADRIAKEGQYTHFLGNFNGWVQYRKLIPHEHDILGARS